MPPAAASAPGKVLLAGGYLVLDRRHTGLVLSLDARIHAVVAEHQSSDLNLDSETATITVCSPQFTEAEWVYSVRRCSDTTVVVEWIRPSTDDGKKCQSPNPFVETTIAYVLSYLAARPGPDGPTVFRSSRIRILADTGYYTLPPTAQKQQQQQQQQQQSTEPRSRFHNFGIPLSHAHKTGLGSSAALVTALVAALVQFYHPESSSVPSSPPPPPRRIVHNLAQAAHCAAQGKVGSGFDVAAAVYGSCLYRRFSPSVLDSGSFTSPSSPGFASWLANLVDDADSKIWDTDVDDAAVSFPLHRLRLVLCDVDCGSKTPGMVRDVLKWKRDVGKPADELWDRIQTRNDTLRESLSRLARRPAGTESPETAGDEYEAIAHAIDSIRSLVRDMSTHSSVPIEPPVQTRLLDHVVANVPGVVGGVVPGAGGFDAVAFLIRDSDGDSTVGRLKTFLSTFDFFGDVPEKRGTGVGKVSVLPVRHDDRAGVAVESPDMYAEWL